MLAIAILGWALNGVVTLVSGPEPSHEAPTVVAGLLACLAVAFLFVINELKTLRSSFIAAAIPFGCYLLVGQLCRLVMGPVQNSSSTSGLDVTIGWAVGAFGMILVGLAFVAMTNWMACIVVEVALGGSTGLSLEGALIPGWQRASRRWKAGTLAIAVGSGVPVVIAVAMMEAMPGLRGNGLAPVVFCLSVVWNLGTAGLLTSVVASEDRPFKSFVQALRTSRRWKEWLLPVGLHSSLMGLFASATAVRYLPDGGIEVNRTWTVNGDWLGAFPAESSWLGQMQLAAKSPPLGLAAIGLTILLLGASIGLRLHVARRILTNDAVDLALRARLTAAGNRTQEAWSMWRKRCVRRLR